jgi:hypothetical protein
VSPAPGASPSVDKDGIILAFWGDRGQDDIGFPVAPPSARPVTKKDRPTPSKRQRRTHELLRGAETRPVRIRSKDIYTGDVPMARANGKLVSGEGFTEILAWIVLEFHVEDMVGAFAQTDKTRIRMFGVKHDWTPDGEIKRRLDRDLLFEVKTLEAIQPGPDTLPAIAAVMRERFRSMAAEAERQGKDFLLLTEHEVRMEPRFHNAKMMFRALASNIGDDVLDAVRYVLHDMEEVLSVRDLADAVPALRSSMLLVACLLDRCGDIRLDRRNFFGTECEFENYLSSAGGVPPTGKTHSGSGS